MLTLLEILNKTTDYFQKCGVPDARLDAQYILAKGLGLTRMDLYLNFDRPMLDKDLELLRPMVQRRGKREPLQHVLGSTSFRGHEIICDRRALIPRPETEVLVDLVLAKIPMDAPSTLLDIGTGTGAIAIAIAKERPHCQITAVDISPEALALAGENVIAHKLEDRIHLQLSSGMETIQNIIFDFVVSNPPYIPTATLNSLESEVRDFDPKLALDGGADGLALVRDLIRQIHTNTPESSVYFELGEQQPHQIKAEFETEKQGFWPEIRISKDLQGVERFLILSH